MRDSFEYDTQRHNLILFKIAHDLTKNGNDVKVDYTMGELGHLRIGNNNGLLLIKALPNNRAFPVTSEEISNMANFQYVLLCSIAEDGMLDIYKVPVSLILSICKNWKIKGQGEVMWIELVDYLQFKTDVFAL
ncbi:MAG: hypothetical protein ACYDCP_09870 [Thermoplasmataceae archaeon]